VSQESIRCDFIEALLSNPGASCTLFLGARHSRVFPMVRDIETALALLLIPVSAFCLWRFSYVTGAVYATVAQTFSVILYMAANRKRN
jgi:hypothetical protein